MKDLTKKRKNLVLEKILEEMKFALDDLYKQGFSWTEKCSATRCDSLSELSYMDIDLMQKKYGNHYNLIDYKETEPNDYLPIKKAELIDDYHDKKHVFEFENVLWYGINSKRNKRIFQFSNDGNIYFEKNWIGKLTKKKPKSISYNISYNVLEDNYQIEYFEKNYNNESNDITFSFENNKLNLILNNISIIKDLENKTKNVKIFTNRKRGRYTIENELSFYLDYNNTIIESNLTSTIKKEHEDGYKNYIFNVEKSKLKAYNVDNDKTITNIMKSPRLLDLAVNLICGGEKNNTLEFKILYEYLEKFLKTVNENLYKNTIIFNDTIDGISRVENKVIDTIKEIKGEIPLNNFKEKLENSLQKNKEKIKG